MRRSPRYHVKVIANGEVCVKYRDDCGDWQERVWMVVGRERGYVYDITDKPGTLGKQICEDSGSTLYCSRDQLPAAARKLLREWADNNDKEQDQQFR